ncbi:MAG: NAD(+) synthase [Gammaproteobacteria bacterium]|nr:NAD(+) synthase [Gammaproteobacteria bacterium]
MAASVTEDLLDLDCGFVVDEICAQLKETIVRFRRRGAVVAVSGGVDSAVCLALSAHAIGPERVLALLLPERESSPDSERLAREVISLLGVPYERHDITSALEGLGCYEARDEAIRHVIPEYAGGWRNKLVIGGGLSGQFNHFHLVAAGPDGKRVERRLGLREYLQIVAATNFKQRTRKAMEYYHADRLNYVVIGTPNRLEYDQGFFVKNGDGAADIKPIAHLYKTQVYALARYMQLPEEIVSSIPTSDTYSLPQEQESFYFALPYQQLDVALWHVEKGRPAAELAEALGIDTEFAARIYADIAAKRRTTRYLHEPPVLLAAHA